MPLAQTNYLNVQPNGTTQASFPGGVKVQQAAYPYTSAQVQNAVVWTDAAGNIRGYIVGVGEASSVTSNVQIASGVNGNSGINLNETGPSNSVVAYAQAASATIINDQRQSTFLAMGQNKKVDVATGLVGWTGAAYVPQHTVGFAAGGASRPAPGICDLVMFGSWDGVEDVLSIQFTPYNAPGPLVGTCLLINSAPLIVRVQMNGSGNGLAVDSSFSLTVTYSRT